MKILDKKTTVLLDLDGTLVDSVGPHAHSWKEVLQAHGFEVELKELKRLIGMGGDKMLQEAVGKLNEETLDALSKERSEHFRSKQIRDVSAFTGAGRLIDLLRERGLTVRLATAASSKDRDPLLEQAGLKEKFDDFVSTDEVEGSKPEPDLIEAILDKLGVSPSECVMVGDSIFDAEAAHRAGVDFIGVESGAYSGEELPHTSQIFPSITEFAEALESSKTDSVNQNQEGETLAWI